MASTKTRKPTPVAPEPAPVPVSERVAGAQGPAITLAGQPYRLAVLTLQALADGQELLSAPIPDYGLYHGATIGETVVNGLIVGRRFEAMDAILAYYVADAPAGIAARCGRAELAAAVDAIFSFSGYELLAMALQVGAERAGALFQTAVRKAAGEALPDAMDGVAEGLAAAIVAAEQAEGGAA